MIITRHGQHRYYESLFVLSFVEYVVVARIRIFQPN